MDKDNFDQPLLTQIHEVFVVNYRVLLETKRLHIHEFNNHSHSYVVSDCHETSHFLWSNELKDYHVYGMYTKPNGTNTCTKNIVVKYNIYV